MKNNITITRVLHHPTHKDLVHAAATQAAEIVENLAQHSPETLTTYIHHILSLHLHLSQLAIIGNLNPEGQSLLDTLTSAAEQSGIQLTLTSTIHTNP